MKAATRGEVGIVKLLLEWGADKDAKNNVKNPLFSICFVQLSTNFKIVLLYLTPLLLFDHIDIFLFHVIGWLNSPHGSCM
jgi:hypothetical protein